MNIGGKERKLKFGINQSITYCEILNIDISDMDESFQRMANGKGTGTELRALFYSALKDGARIEKSEFNYTVEDIGDWLDEVTPEEIQVAIGEMVSTLAKGKNVAKKK